MARKKAASKKETVAPENFSLISQVRGVLGKDGLGKESTWYPTFKTGFDLFDYRNGKSEDGVVSLGIDGGKILYGVGNSGAGKTTLLTQMATHIADQYEQSNVMHFDTERATSRVRIRQISGWTLDRFNQKYIHMEENVSTESFYKTIKALAKIKKENYDVLKIESNEVDMHGNKVFYLPPTICILDSLALLTPDNIESEEELSGQMSATAVARANTSVFKRLMSSLREANILLFVVNHINEKVDINPMAKTQAQVNFLKTNETLPGGRAPIYLSNCLIKLVTSTKLTEDKLYGIKGFEVVLELIKSRSNAAGVKVTMVFDQVNGYDNLLSNLLFMKDLKKLGGGGIGYYLPSVPTIKFSLKNFKEKYHANPELKKAFDAELKEELLNFIPDPTIDGEADDLNEVMEEDIEFTPVEGEENLFTDGENKYYQKEDDGSFTEVEVQFQ